MDFNWNLRDFNELIRAAEANPYMSSIIDGPPTATIIISFANIALFRNIQKFFPYVDLLCPIAKLTHKTHPIPSPPNPIRSYFINFNNHTILPE